MHLANTIDNAQSGHWPSLEGALAESVSSGAVTAAQLGRADLPGLAAATEGWLPDVGVGFEARLLGSDYLDGRAALRGEAAGLDERPLYVVTLRAGDELAGLVVLEFHAAERAVAGRLSVVAPKWRGRGLGRALIVAEEIVGRAIGATMVYGLAELDNLPQCAILEREGRRLCGIVPESERRRVAPGVLRSVPEALYIKPLVPLDEALRPRAEDLVSRTAALFALLGHTDIVARVPAVLSPLAPVPRLPPSLAARLAARPGGADTWPDIAEVAPALRLPPGYRLETLHREDIPRLVASLPAWYPDLDACTLAHLIDPSYYEEHVALAGEERRVAERPGCVALLRRGDDIAGFVAGSCDAPNSTFVYEFAGVAPGHRGTRIAAACAPLPALIAETIEIETLLAWVNLRGGRASQRWVQLGGWRPWGVTPAVVRAHHGGPRTMMHGLEALYGISRVPPAASHWPDLSSLPPHLAALARFLRDQERAAWGEAPGAAA